MGQALSFLILLALIVIVAGALVTGGWYAMEYTLKLLDDLFRELNDVIVQYWWVPVLGIAGIGVPIGLLLLLENYQEHRRQRKAYRAKVKTQLEYERRQETEARRLRSERFALQQQLSRLKAQR